MVRPRLPRIRYSLRSFFIALLVLSLIPSGDRSFCLGSSAIGETGTQVGNFSSVGKQSPRNSLEGEFTLTARVERDQVGGWKFVVSYPEGGMAAGIMPPHSDWLSAADHHGVRSTRKTHADVAGYKRKTESFAADEPVVLLRLRAPTPEQAANHKPCDGVMVWFDKHPFPMAKKDVKPRSETSDSSSP